MKSSMKKIATTFMMTLLPLSSALAEPIQHGGQFQSINIGDYLKPTVLWKLDTVGTVQVLSQSSDEPRDTTNAPPLTSGFQAAVGNASIIAHLARGLDVFTEWYISSQHHPGEVTDRQGYILITGLPESLNDGKLNNLFENYVNLKVGHFEIDFGNQHWTRSDNADVQRNPLIGNYLVDPNTTEAGAELIGRYGLLHGVVGAGNGTTVQDFAAGNQLCKHAKAWVEPKDHRFNVAASWFRVNHSALDPVTGEAEGTEVEMFVRNRSGSRYSSVINQNPWDEDKAEGGQPSFGVGSDITAWQFDANARLTSRLNVEGLYGLFRDDDLNFNQPGTPKEKWSYYGGQVRWDQTKSLYYAARYSEAKTSRLQDIEMDGRIRRIQVGLGYWIMKGILVKTEYVLQRYLGFTQPVDVLAPGGTAQIDYTGNPRFSGVLAELSMAFGGTLLGEQK